MVIIDTAQEVGVTSFVIGIPRGNNTPEYVDKIRKVLCKEILRSEIGILQNCGS